VATRFCKTKPIAVRRIYKTNSIPGDVGVTIRTQFGTPWGYAACAARPGEAFCNSNPIRTGGETKKRSHFRRDVAFTIRTQFGMPWADAASAACPGTALCNSNPISVRSGNEKTKPFSPRRRIYNSNPIRHALGRRGLRRMSGDGVLQLKNEVYNSNPNSDRRYGNDRGGDVPRSR